MGFLVEKYAQGSRFDQLHCCLLDLLFFSISKLSVRYLTDSLLTRLSPSVRIVRPLVLTRTVDPYQPNTSTRDKGVVVGITTGHGARAEMAPSRVNDDVRSACRRQQGRRAGRAGKTPTKGAVGH